MLIDLLFLKWAVLNWSLISETGDWWGQCHKLCKKNMIMVTCTKFVPAPLFLHMPVYLRWRTWSIVRWNRCWHMLLMFVSLHGTRLRWLFFMGNTKTARKTTTKRSSHTKNSNIFLHKQGSILSSNRFGIYPGNLHNFSNLFDRVDELWIVIKITLNYAQTENCDDVMSYPLCWKKKSVYW